MFAHIYTHPLHGFVNLLYICSNQKSSCFFKKKAFLWSKGTEMFHQYFTWILQTGIYIFLDKGRGEVRVQNK